MAELGKCELIFYIACLGDFGHFFYLFEWDNYITYMTAKETLYSSIKHIREQEFKPSYRVLMSGYLNDD